jgi:uncharacterized protein
LSRQHHIELAGLAFVPDLSGALYQPDEKLLLVADLHLEQGAALARRRLHVPPYDTAQTLSMLERVLADIKPKRLIMLGDSFHDAAAADLVPSTDAARLSALCQGLDVVWISGNHDPHAHTTFGGTCVDELSFAGISLRHIPARLAADESEIAGHLHPGASLEQRGTTLRGKCFASDHRRIIMPAFGSYTGSVNLRSSAFRGLLDAATTEATLIGRTALHRFPLKRLR